MTLSYTPSMAAEKRFHGKLSEDYQLFRKARAHWDELERQVGAAIGRHRGTNGTTYTAVELGCGTGFTTAAILKHRPHVRLTALDNEEQMVAQARRNLRAWKGSVKVVRADALSFLSRLRAGTVDAVGTKFTLHNLERGYRDRVMRQIYRVLKPGGLFVNADKYALEGRRQAAELRAQMNRYFDVLVPLGRHDLYTEVVAHYMTDEDEAHVLREARAVRDMKRLGFRDVRRTLRRGMDAVYLALK